MVVGGSCFRLFGNWVWVDLDEYGWILDNVWMKGWWLEIIVNVGVNLKLEMCCFGGYIFKLDLCSYLSMYEWNISFWSGEFKVGCFYLLLRVCKNCIFL